jgi:hypothetical protein
MKNLGDTPNAQNPWAPPTPTPTPAQADAPTPIYRYPLKRTAGAVKGANSRMRDGEIFLAPAGIRLVGKAVPGQTEQIMAGVMGGGIGGLIMEYSREHRQEDIPWETVETVVLEPHKQKICFVYHNPDNFGGFCSLVLQYKDAATYQNIVQATRYFVPYKVKEGVIPNLGVTVLFVFLGIFVIALIYAALNAPRG